MHLYEHELQITNRQMLIDITEVVKKDLEKSSIKEGIAVIYCPHTTAGITINENADSDVKTDLISGLEKVYPTTDKRYLHYEGN